MGKICIYILLILAFGVMTTFAYTPVHAQQFQRSNLQLNFSQAAQNHILATSKNRTEDQSAFHITPNGCASLAGQFAITIGTGFLLGAPIGYAFANTSNCNGMFCNLDDFVVGFTVGYTLGCGLGTSIFGKIQNMEGNPMLATSVTLSVGMALSILENPYLTVIICPLAAVIIYNITHQMNVKKNQQAIIHIDDNSVALNIPRVNYRVTSNNTIIPSIILANVNF